MKKIITLAIVSLLLLIRAHAFEARILFNRDISLVDLSEIIVFESELLVAFWYGDDGVDCGEPLIKDLNIYFQQNLISFDVIPKGLVHSCELREMHCEINFTLSNENLISVLNDPIYNYKNCLVK